MSKVKVYNTCDTMTAQLIQDRLKKKGIVAEMRQNSVGEYLNIFMGFSVYGIDILVDQENEESAKGIIKNIILLDNEEEDKIRVPWFKNKKIVASVILVFFLFGIFFSLINFLIGLLN